MLAFPVCFQAAATTPELPYGVFRGCPDCRSCQKVNFETCHLGLSNCALLQATSKSGQLYWPPETGRGNLAAG